MSIVKKVVVATMATVAITLTTAVVSAKHPEPINKIYDGTITGVQDFGKGAMNKVSKVFNRNSQKSEVEMESKISE